MSKIDKRIDFFDKYFPNHSLSKDGVNLNIWCPFCKNENKHKKKMVVHLEKCLYHCWTCDKKGANVPYLISKFSSKLAKIAEQLFTKKLNNNAVDLFGNNLLIEEEHDPVVLPANFVFFVDQIESFSPDTKAVLKYAVSRGFTKHKLFMLRAGFSTSSEYRRYLILPSYDANGNLNYYVSRKIDVGTGDSFKYKNANYPKKKIIFNEININWTLPLTIVEGPLDLIKTNDNATCLLGSSLTEDMLLFQKIVSHKTTINLALDSDVYNKSLNIASLLHRYDIPVNIIDTRGADDVGDMHPEDFERRLNLSKEFNKNDKLLAKIRSL